MNQNNAMMEAGRLMLMMMMMTTMMGEKNFLDLAVAVGGRRMRIGAKPPGTVDW